jgi:hypothetical protein
MRSVVVGSLLVVALASASCSSDDSESAPTTTERSVADGVDCQAAGIVVVANETLGNILETGLVPVGTAFTAAETQAAIDQSIPPMAEALVELLPAMNRAVADLRPTLVEDVRPALDEYIDFIQEYATLAAAIEDSAGFEATLRLEESERSASFDDALLQVDAVLRSECGVTLQIDRPDTTQPGAIAPG